MLKLSILQQINVILNKLSCAGAVRLQRQIDHGLMDIHLKFTEFCCFFGPKKFQEKKGWFKKMLGPKKGWVQKKMMDPKKIMDPKKMMDPKNFWVRTNFWS